MLSHMQICSVPAVIKMQVYLWQIRSEDYFSVRMSTEMHTSVNKPVFPPGSKNTEIFYYPTISPALRCHGQAQKQYSCLSTSALSFLSPSNVNFHSICLTAFLILSYMFGYFIGMLIYVPCACLLPTQARRGHQIP